MEAFVTAASARFAIMQGNTEVHTCVSRLSDMQNPLPASSINGYASVPHLLSE